MQKQAGWRRKSPAALLLAILLTLAQVQFSLAAIVNTVTASGTANGLPVTANAMESVDVANAAPAMTVLKSGVLNDDDGTPGLTAGDTIAFTVTIANTGNISLTGVALTDPMLTLAYVSGDALAVGMLDPGETWTYTGSYVLLQTDIDSNGGGDGYIDNTATVATNELPDQPTAASVPLPAVIASVTGTVFVDSNGNSIVDPGEASAGAGYIVELYDSLNILVATTTTDASGNYAFNTVPGTNYRIEFKTPMGALLGVINNLTLAPGNTVIDQNQPIDPSGFVYNSVTRAGVPGATVVITDAADVPLPAACLVNAGQQSQVTGPTGYYRFDVVPAGAAACPPGETEYRIAITVPAGYSPGFSAVLLPQAGPLDATVCAIDAVPGGACQVDANQSPPTAASVVYFLAFLLAAGDRDVVNNHLPIDPIGIGTGNLTKTALREEVRRGEQVPYVISAAAVTFTPAQIIDIMPPGFTLVPGSVTANAVPVVPIIDGRNLTFNGLVPDVAGAIIIRLTLVATAAVTPGEYVNQALLVDPATGATVGAAQDSVRVVTEAVFDCSDIIGRVFDDKNCNGYADENEPGLPGVRLATVRGILVTTDKHGRFNVPCAAVPDADIGSNFIMKLDTRALPTGYSLTTENPRDVRVTRGKVVKLNFGAAISQLVRLDIRDEAFVPGSTALQPAWADGIVKLVAILEQNPSILRITYFVGADTMDLVTKRLGAVEKIVRKEWRKRSRDSQLPIEVRVMDNR